jgi:AcrR family transcriptional regulator
MDDSNPPASRYDQRRIDIMHAAAAVFSEKGFHGASTQDIAGRLGMKQGSLYYYFPSKEAALEAVCLYGISESVARLKLLVAAEQALPEKIHRIIHSQIYGLQTRCDHLIVFTQQRRFLPPELREQIRAESQQYQRLIDSMLRDAQAQGQIDASVDIGLAVRALIGLCNSVASWFRQEAVQDVDHIAQQYARLFYAGIQSAPQEIPA